MNEKKVAFIICTNNDMMYSECVTYLQRLELPEGFDAEVIQIKEAKSMTAGYNEGMHSTDAKYKIYLHHDLFIIRADFLKRVIEAFVEHPEIGIMGILGMDRILSDANYWNQWNVGQVYAFDVMKGYNISLDGMKDVLVEAVALDGMILMTQYDVEWREDVFTGWDFYDVSQCFEFAQKGYQVAVFCETENSCLHDCGYSKLGKYDEGREVFCKEYAAYGHCFLEEGQAKKIDEGTDYIDEFKDKLNYLLQTDIKAAKSLVDTVYECGRKNNFFATMKAIFDIYTKELEEGKENLFVKIGDEWEELVEKYTLYKFLIRRVEFDVCEDAVKILYNAVREKEITMRAINEIMRHSSCDGSVIVKKLQREIDACINNSEEECLDNKKIAFIYCGDNEQYYEESVRYIQDLEVPEGYSIDVYCVTEAVSIAAGYNEAMQASDAKYKVYMQEGTFILNRRIIYDMLELFQNDTTIGMLGVVGTTELSKNAFCHKDWNVGNLISYDGRRIRDNYLVQSEAKAYIPVWAVDGTLVVTQYDVVWREDIFEGQYFYDVSHSLDMLKLGLRVVVPYQEDAWCYSHERSYDWQKYDTDRRRIIKEYRDFFEGKAENVTIEGCEEINGIRETLISLIENADYENLLVLMDEIRLFGLNDIQIREIANLMEIYQLEEESTWGKHSEIFQLQSWQMIYQYYQWIHFVVLRMAYAREDERIDKLKLLVKEGRISNDTIRKIVGISQNGTAFNYLEMLETAEEKPLVSVIIPVYNGEEFIRQTLESVLNQTYKNIEIIIVDDCSSDKSRDVIDSYTDSRIRRVYLEKNRNICYAGNVGFEEAQGKYIALIGHDDIWKPEKIEKQISFMEEHPTHSVCFTWVDIIDEEENKRNKEHQGLYNAFCTENCSQSLWNRRLFELGNVFCAPSAFIKASYLRETEYYRYALVQLQDYDLWIRLITKGPFYVLQEKLTLYRRFNDEGKNLSAINTATLNRDSHEKQWIKANYIKNLCNEQFVRFFKGSMKNPNAITEKEIACEKAFMLWNIGNCFAEKWFIEILEDEECRDILEEKYSFELKDFYRMNTGTMRFD